MLVVRRVVMWLTVLIVTSLVLAFVLENQQGVSLSFLGWATGELPVSFFIVLALIMGMVIGPFIAALMVARCSQPTRHVSAENRGVP